MAKPRFLNAKAALSGFLILALSLAVACGTAAPPAAPADPPPPAANGAQPAPTAAPAPATDPGPTVTDKRLRVATQVPTAEVNDSFLATRTPTMVTHFYELLLQVDRHDGEFVPMLAASWEMSPDGRSWTANLREGVPWHGDYGEFTAQDVAHTLGRMTRDESITTNAGYWRRTLDRVEVVNDHEAVFHLNTVELGWELLVSSFWDLIMVSSNQFDREGQEGFAARPTGTGPYQFVQRTLGRGILFERVPYEHWRLTPDFGELEFIFAREELTRLAMLLTDEADIVEDISIDLQGDALGRGMEVVRSSIPSGAFQGLFGGNFLPSKPEYQAGAPLTNRAVREALNRAVNRHEIIDNIFAGKYEPVTAYYAHPSHPEFKPEFEEKFWGMYGYDPQRARELLAEAGYPDGFNVTFRLQAQPGTPRQDDVGEAVANYWSEIGVNVNIEVVEFAVNRTAYTTMQTHNIAWVQQTVYRPPWNRIQVFNIADSVVHSYESELIEETWARMKQTTDPDEHLRLTQDILEHLMDEYAQLPLLWIFPEFLINPNVVAEYVTAGIGGASDSEYTRAR